MAAPLSIKSDFALLDVKAGRKLLARHFETRPGIGVCPPHLRIPVTIRGYIDGINGRDDGVSMEFSVHVEAVDLGSPAKATGDA